MASDETKHALEVQRRYGLRLAAASGLDEIRLLDSTEMPRWTGPVPADVTSTEVDADSVACLMLAPPDVDDARVVVYVHGGGFVLGSPESVSATAAISARTARARVLLPRYRLAPEHPYPAAVEDVVTAYRWLLRTGHLASGIVLAGESAGGGAVAAALVALRDAGEALPAAAVLISPVVDLECSAASWWRNADRDGFVRREGSLRNAAMFLAGLDPRLTSPLHADLTGLPPLLVLAGEAECSVDGSTAYAEKAAASGGDVTVKVWDEMPHLWHNMKFLPEAVEAMDMIGQFVMTHTTSPAPSAVGGSR